MGARYTRGKGPFKLVYTEVFGSHKAAAQREIEIKGWSREKKLNLLKSKCKD
jgi:putative endonuclease